jgi:hypothetical protein
MLALHPVEAAAKSARARVLPQYGRFPHGMERTMIQTNTINKTLSAAAICIALTAPALAEQETPDSEHGRYSFSKVAEGFLRLDTQTGQVSVCSQRAVGWACQAAPDDRAVLENEIARLRAENAGLKKEMLAHGLALPGTAAPESSGAHDSGSHDNDITIRLPDNADIDRIVAYAGQLWHRFVEAIARAQKQVLNNKS